MNETPSEDRFAGRVALVTGAGSGIGRAVARRLYQEGASVALLGRTREKLQEAAAEHRDDRTLLLEVAHEDPDAVTAAVQQTIDRFGALDIVVNNAGQYTRGTVADTDQSDWNHALDVNLTGPFLVTKAALPHLRSSRFGGVIVNVASTLALSPVPGTMPYCVAKAGMVMLTRSTAIEEAKNGVRALVICPGVVDTPIHQYGWGEAGEKRAEFLDQMGSLHPLGRVGTADEVADLVLFLSSDASKWTTGAVIPIDGGISLA